MLIEHGLLVLGVAPAHKHQTRYHFLRAEAVDVLAELRVDVVDVRLRDRDVGVLAEQAQGGRQCPGAEVVSRHKF